MPVVAQGCRTKAGVTGPVADRAVMQPRSNVAHVYADDELDPNTLKGAIAAAQNARTLQTANAAAFLTATGESGRHKYAGQNVRIKNSSTSTGTNNTKTGYITEKGLFKEWSDNNLMTRSGKYGCPAATAITDLTGSGNDYSVPNLNQVKGSYTGGTNGKVNYGSYVGAPITKAAANSDPTMFMGSKFAQTTWDGNDATLPACGNEGSNVQVVYPAKATGASYRGTYNETDYMTKQDDISNPTYDTCKQRAEDVGHSVFGLSSDKCYTAPRLDESIKGNIAYEVSKSKVVYSGPTPAKQLHFSMNGFLTLLKEPNDEGKTKNVKGFPSDNTSLYEIGRGDYTSQNESTIPNKCLYGYGGIMVEQPTGTWGEGCNSIRIPYWRYQ